MAKKEVFNIISVNETQLSIYAVQSKDGKFFRAKGDNGGGNSWVDDIEKAKLYFKVGPAKSIVSWWAKNYPDYGVPNLIRIIANKYEVIDQVDRVKGTIETAKIRVIKSRISYVECQIKNLLKQKDSDVKRLDELRINLASYQEELNNKNT